MNIINLWRDYESGKLTPPCVVQYDIIGKEHLIWVWAGEQIKLFNRAKYDEKTILNDAVMIIKEPVIIDQKDILITELTNKVATLEMEKELLIKEAK